MLQIFAKDKNFCNELQELRKFDTPLPAFHSSYSKTKKSQKEIVEKPEVSEPLSDPAEKIIEALRIQKQTVQASKVAALEVLLQNPNAKPTQCQLKKGHLDTLSLNDLVSLFKRIQNLRNMCISRTMHPDFHAGDNDFAYIFEETGTYGLFGSHGKTHTSWKILHAIKEGIITKCSEVAQLNEEDFQKTVNAQDTASITKYAVENNETSRTEKNTIDGVSVDDIKDILSVQLGRISSMGETRSYKKLRKTMNIEPTDLFRDLNATKTRKNNLYSLFFPGERRKVHLRCGDAGHIPDPLNRMGR